MYSVVVGWRPVGSPDDSFSDSRQIDVYAPSAPAAIVAATNAVQGTLSNGDEVVSTIVLSPAEERELRGLEGSGNFS